MLKKRTKKKLAQKCLLLAMFFLPAGYDALFKFVMNLTGSYWVADSMFYFIFAAFLSGYFYFSETNPITAFIKQKKIIVKNIKKRMPWLFKKKVSRTRKKISSPKSLRSKV